MNDSMKFRYILWDNDGVLVDTERYYFQASREALENIGICLTRQDFARISLTEGRSIFDLAKSHNLPGQEIEDLRRWRNARYAELLETEDLGFAGPLETLTSLHGRIGMAIVTSALNSHFHIIHRRTGMLPFFDFCLVREDYTLSKPAPEAYLLALQRSGYPAKEVLVIEDSPRGLAAAKAAGLTCWVIPGAEHDVAVDFPHADRILHDLAELPGLIR
ncbi:MAG: HAD family hydrolase [Desulfuromonadales bacterium]